MKIYNIGFFAVTFATLALSACNGDPEAPGGGAQSQISSPKNAEGSNPTVSGQSCESNDPDKICMAIRFVSYTNSSGDAAASEDEAANITRKMNEVWGQCNIGFQVETYEAVDPANYGLAYGATSQNQTSAIRDTFSNSNQLLAVTTGPWGTAVNAWTAMPGSGPYGAIMEASIVNYGDGIIYAHEFGHYLGLDHASSSAYLMSAVISKTSDALSESECQTARDTARSYWAATLR